MLRRNFLRGTAAFGFGALAALFTGDQGGNDSVHAESIEFSVQHDDNDNAGRRRGHCPIEWKVVTTDFDGNTFNALTEVARIVREVTDGAFVLDIESVQMSSADVLNGLANNSINADAASLSAAFLFDSAPGAALANGAPFLMTRQQFFGWLYGAGGVEQLRNYFHDAVGAIPLALYLSGTVQMGGWFKTPINSIADIQGLRFRLPSLGQVIWNQLGGVGISLPPAEIVPAMQNGTLDAAEFVGPSLDLALGLHTVASNYYKGGWWEPHNAVYIWTTRRQGRKLPARFRLAVEVAARSVVTTNFAASDANDATALQQIEADPALTLQDFPTDITAQAKVLADQFYNDKRAADPLFATLYDHYRAHLDAARPWYAANEVAYYNNVVL